MRPPKVVWYCQYTGLVDYPRKRLCHGCRIKAKCPGIIKYPRGKESKR